MATDARRIPIATRHARRRQRALAHVENLESRRLFAAIAWDGGPSGNGTDWFTAANWAGDVIPGVNDDVTLGLTGSSPTISAPFTVSVRSLTSARNLSWSNAFNLAAPSSFAAGTTATQNSNGELGGAGTLSISGNMVWAGGLLLGGGTIRIENGGTFSKTFDGGSLLRNLDNFGTMQLGGTFGLGNGAVITNQPGKTINVTAGNISHPVGAVGEINNLGKLNFNLTAGSTTLLGIRVVNSGVWSVASGTVTMNFAGSSTGEIRTLAGAFLDFATLFTLGTGASLSGAGRVRNTGSSFILTGAASVSSTNFQSIGGIEGSGDLTIAPGGVMDWLSGQFSGTGKLIVGSGGTLNVESGVLSRTLDNSGTINRRPRASDGSEQLVWTFNGGRLNNLSTGLLSITTRGAIIGGDAGALGTNLLRNEGLITTAAGVIGSPMQFQVPVQNTTAGTLRTISGFTIFNAINSSSSAGILESLPGARLSFGSRFTLNTGARIRGGGLVVNETGELVVAGATTLEDNVFTNASVISGPGDLTIAPGGTMTWLSEQISGTGKLIVSSGGTLNVESGVLSRTLDNSGTINRRPRALDGRDDVAWTFNGGRLNNLSGGLLSVTTRGAIIGGEVGPLGANLLRNEGLITTAAGVIGSPMQFQVPVDNTAAGTLRAVSGVATFNATTSASSAGILESLPGARLSFGSRFTLNTGAVIRGGGLVVNETGDQLVVAGPTTLENVDFTTTSTISGPGDLTVGTGAAYNWPQGIIQGTGKLIVSSAATLNINVQGVGLRRTLENFGTVNIQTNNFVTFNGGTLDNKPGATLNLISGVGLVGGVSGSLGANKLINSGLIVGQLGAGSISSDVEFTNTGILRMTSGTFVLNSTPTNVSGSTLTGGTWQMLGGTLNTPTFNVSTNAATIELAGGSWSGAGAIINNNGTLKLSNGVDYSRNFAFVNNGVLDLSPGSILTTLGTNPYTQGAAGTLITRVRGPLLTDFGRVASGGDFTLGGTLTAVFEQNYVPDPVPQLFDTVQSIRSRIGSFAQVTSSGLPGFLVANANYTATKAQLNVELGGAVWTGLGDGTTWTQAANWLGNVLPTAQQEVTIDVPTSPTIRIPAGADITIRKLVHSERLEITGALTITEASTVAGTVEAKPNGRLSLLANSTFTTLHIDTAGQLDGPGNITVTTAMDLAGTVTGTGSLTLVAGTAFRASYASGKDPLIDRALTVQGQGTIANASLGVSATISFGSNGSITVAPGSVMVFERRVKLVGTSASFGRLINAGELRFSSSGVSQLDVPFDSSGQVTIPGGEVSVNRGGFASGNFNVANNGLLRFDMQIPSNDTYSVNGPLTIGGSGSVQVERGTLSLSNTLSIETTGVNQLLTNLIGSGQLRVQSNLTLLQATLGGSGVIAVVPGGTLSAPGRSFVGRSIDNSGRIEIIGSTGSPLVFTDGGNVINRAAGTVAFSGSGIGIAKTGSGHFIRNLGLLTTASGSFGGYIEIPVTNTATGRIRVNCNSLELRSPSSLEGTEVQVAAGSDLVLASQVNLTASTILAGPGTVVFSGGVITLPSGAQTTGNVFLEVATGELVVSGTINPGRLIVLKDGTATINANQTLLSVFTSGLFRGNGNLLISNTFVWLGGTLAGPGTLVLPSTTRVLGETPGNPPRVISREVRTSGLLEIGAPSIGFAGGKLVINAPGELWFTTSSVLGLQSGVNGLVNNGLLIVPQLSKPVSISVDIPLTNTTTGTVQIDSLNTTLALSDISGSVTGQTLTGGTWLVGRAGTLVTPPNAFNSNAAQVSLSGKTPTWSGLSQVNSNSGLIQLGDGTLFTMSAGLTNFGTLELDARSELRLNGDFSQSNAGILKIRLDPRKAGSGVLNATGRNVQLGGTLQISSTGPASKPFSVTLIRAKKITGTFSNVLLPADNEFGVWRSRQFTTRVTLSFGESQTSQPKGG